MTSGKTACTILVFCIATAIASPAQIFEIVAAFDSTNGSVPTGLLAQGTDGNFYGTTLGGGTFGYGAVFSTNVKGAITALYSFCQSDEDSCFNGYAPQGDYPWSGLVQASNGNFYGTASYGGTYGGGTVFEVTPQGKFTTLYSFDFDDGSAPEGGLIQGSDGNLYGTTSGFENGPGTVFRITPTGNLTTLYTFCSQPNCADGYTPFAALVQAADGNFYGTTYAGGANGEGTIFEVTLAGDLTTLYSFCSQRHCTDGSKPIGGLVQATNGNFYGTTWWGGIFGGVNGGGTLFEITGTGRFTVLHSFCAQPNCADGENPSAGLMQASDGNLYGTTQNGGLGSGTVFQVTPQGKLTSLHAFEYSDGGAYPDSNLLEATNGKIYGTTEGGFCGTVFALSLGLAPSIDVRPAVASAGKKVAILGNNLTSAASVSFGGVPTAFTIVSDTEITAMVPPGAATGKVEVTAGSAVIYSKTAFRVLE
jgi:uncharacterized repeat protein (TIGR03803 family)